MYDSFSWGVDESDYIYDIDKISIRSLAESYIVDQFKNDDLKPSAILSAIEDCIPGDKPYLMNGEWLDKVTSEQIAGFDEHMSKPLSQITNGVISSNASMISFTGPVSELVKDCSLTGNKIDLSTLALRNPNNIPIRYYAVVLKDIKLSFKVIISYDYLPSERGFIYKLKVFNESGSLVRTLYNMDDIDRYNHRQSYFNVIGLYEGYYTFKVYFLDKEICNETRYIWNRNDIELTIDESFRLKDSVSGSITWNDGRAINDVHVKVENLDYEIVYYGEKYQLGSAGTSIKYMQDSYVWNEAPDGPHHLPSQYLDSNENHEFGSYRLLDLIPGRYKLSYFIMPDYNDSYKENGAWTNTDWCREGDSYYRYDILDASLSANGGNSRYEDIESIINGASFSIPMSAIQFSQDGTKLMRDEHAESDLWTVMEVLVCYNATCKILGGEERCVNTSNNSTGGLNKISMRFSVEKQNGQFMVHIQNSMPDFKDEDSNLVSFSYHCIRVLFGEMVAVQTVNIDSSTTTLPTIDVDKMYCKWVQVTANGFNIGAFNQYRATYIEDMENFSKTVRDMGLRGGDGSYLKRQYVGILADSQNREADYELNITKPGAERHIPLGESGFSVDDTYEYVTIEAKSQTSIDIEIKDRALLTNGLDGKISEGKKCHGYAYLGSKLPYKMDVVSNTVDSQELITFTNLLSGENYLYGLYLDNYDESYNGDDSLERLYEYKYYRFNSNEITQPIIPSAVTNESGEILKYEFNVPNQQFKITTVGYDGKSTDFMLQTTPLMMVRDQHSIDPADSSDTTYSITTSNDKNTQSYFKPVRSGYYSDVYYETTDETGASKMVRYLPFVMSESRTFTIYSYLNSIYDVKVKVVSSGAPVSDETVFILDDNRNSYSFVVTDENGEATFTVPAFRCFYFKSQSTGKTTLSPIELNSYHEFTYDIASNAVTDNGIY